MSLRTKLRGKQKGASTGPTRHRPLSTPALRLGSDVARLTPRATRIVETPFGVPALLQAFLHYFFFFPPFFLVAFFFVPFFFAML